MCKGENCETTPRDKSKLYCSRCVKLVRYRDEVAPASTVMVASTSRIKCTGREGCLVQPRNGNMCSTCIRDHAREAQLTVLTTRTELPRSRAAIEAEDDDIAALEGILARMRVGRR